MRKKKKIEVTTFKGKKEVENYLRAEKMDTLTRELANAISEMVDFLKKESDIEFISGAPPHLNWMTFPINCMSPLQSVQVDMESDDFQCDVKEIIENVTDGWDAVGDEYINKEDCDMPDNLVTELIESYQQKFLQILASKDLIKITDYTTEIVGWKEQTKKA